MSARFEHEGDCRHSGYCSAHVFDVGNFGMERRPIVVPRNCAPKRFNFFYDKAGRLWRLEIGQLKTV
jgi:hypothetical protein